MQPSKPVQPSKPRQPITRIRDLLRFLYGRTEGDRAWDALAPRLDAFRRAHPHLQQAPPISERLTERDAILITYGDQFREPGRPPLRTLADFLERHLGDAISGVHLLPFFPYSSDDGFSVIDYRRVDPALGGWEDIHRLGERYRLMFDAVINHISRQSAWFQAYLRGEAPYRGYFIEVAPETDLHAVVRPRALPLLTPVETIHGTRYVWTTFSADQIDLNYANPAVLLEIVDLLLFYVAHGAEIIRLDAIAYLWKDIGTPCIHLPQTHAVVKLFRAVMDAVAPGVLLITETNVPHAENVSYFGDPLPDGSGTDEAQMVYQFSLAPLVLHTFLTGDVRRLTDWASDLHAPAPGATFFNFIASHDGLGVRPAEGLLTPEEIQALVERTQAHGGLISYKTNPDGSQSPYELNITLFDALNDPAHPDPERDVARFLATQAIMLALAGVPGIYVHSLFGSRNCYSCYDRTGRARSLNREKFDLAALEEELSRAEGLKARILYGYAKYLRARQAIPAFHPAQPQQVLDAGTHVFALLRGTPPHLALCLTNVTDQTQSLALGNPSPTTPRWRDVLTGETFHDGNGRLEVTLSPYQTRWLLNGDSDWQLAVCD